MSLQACHKTGPPAVLGGRPPAPPCELCGIHSPAFCLPPAPPAMTKAVGTPWVLPWPLLPPEAESDLLLSGFQPPQHSTSPSPCCLRSKAPGCLAHRGCVCIPTYSLQGLQRQWSGGVSRPQVARVLRSPSLFLEALKLFPRRGVKSLLISHFKIIFALYFSFSDMIVLSREVF